jgi:uncharacterized protein with NAD-binding domain and iron-sulfur cluster
LDAVAQFESSPITGIHLWFDRKITEAEHCVFVDRMSHWLFARGQSKPPGAAERRAYYYQIVISASRDLVGADREALIGTLLEDLAGPCPAVGEAALLASQIVTHREAVFSPLPGSDSLRPPQCTELPWLMLAGDWTATDWPATMEGAVRSGYLAAHAILQARGRSAHCITVDAERKGLARWLVC